MSEWETFLVDGDFGTVSPELGLEFPFLYGPGHEKWPRTLPKSIHESLMPLLWNPYELLKPELGFLQRFRDGKTVLSKANCNTPDNTYTFRIAKTKLNVDCSTFFQIAISDDVFVEVTIDKNNDLSLHCADGMVSFVELKQSPPGKVSLTVQFRGIEGSSNPEKMTLSKITTVRDYLMKRFIQLPDVLSTAVGARFPVILPTMLLAFKASIFVPPGDVYEPDAHDFENSLIWVFQKAWNARQSPILLGAVISDEAVASAVYKTCKDWLPSTDEDFEF